jgi:hypothetical protein
MGVGGDCKSDSIWRANYLFCKDFSFDVEVVSEDAAKHMAGGTSWRRRE